MAKRVRIIAAAGLAGLLALLLAVYAGLLNTGAGRRAVLEMLRPQIEEALGGPFAVGGMGGHWPHRIVLKDVRLADDRGEWLRLSEVKLRWRPLALLSGRIRIKELSAPGGALLRLPEGRERARPALPRLPRLPDLGVETLSVTGLKLSREAAGREAVLNVTGAAQMHGERLRIALDAAAGEGGDRAQILLDWLPGADRLTAQAEIAGPEGGLIARLMGVEQGDVQVSLNGAGPASGWRGALEGRLGEKGRVTGEFRCACGERPRFDLALDGVPGEGMSESARRLLGETPHLEAVIHSPRRGEWAADVTALDVPAAELVRPLHFRLTDVGALRRFDLTGALAPGAALNLPEALGETFEITLRGGFPDSGGLRLAELSLASAKARLTASDLRVAPGGAMTGAGNLRLVSTEGLPEAVVKILGDEAGAEFTLAGTYGQTLRIENITIESAAGTEATGRAALEFADGALDAELAFAVPPAIFAGLTGVRAPEEAISGTLTALGPTASLSARVTARTPQLDPGPRALPPAEAVVVLSGGLAAPSGTATLRRLDDRQAPPLLSAAFAWEGDSLRIADLAAALDGARLEGEAEFTPRSGRLTGRARLDAPDLRALADDAAGSLTAELALEGAAQTGLVLAAKASAPEFAYSGVKAEALELSASGPLSKLSVTAGARALETGAGPFSELSMKAEIRLGEAAAITLTELSARAEGAPVALAAPARITTVSGVVEFPSAVLTWGEGRVTAAARIAPDALKLSADLTRIAVPGRAVLATGSIRVDTEEAAPGAFDLRLEPAGGPDAVLHLAGAWDGGAVAVTGVLEGKGAQVAGARDFLRARLPLRLERGPRGLFFDTGGELDARLDYRGRLEPLLAVFAPRGAGDMKGDLQADIRVSGPLAAPRADGALTLSRGAYENVRTGIELTAIHAGFTFTGSPGGASGALTFSAWDGRKPEPGAAPVTGRGSLTLAAGELQIAAGVALRKATLLRGRDVKATLSGDARLSGTLPALTLAGDLAIDRLDLLIPQNGPEGVVDVPVILVDEKGEPLTPQEENGQAKTGGLTVALDLSVKSDGQAFIRGRGVESEWKADLSAGGTLTQPRLTGPLTLKRGTVNFAGRRFALTRGLVTFTGQSPPDPALDIAAEYRTEDDTNAIVRVSGRTSEPKVELVSEPALPRDQVMALVLFGKPVTELTALQALQVTQSVAQLTGTGPFAGGSIMDRARRTLGLDLLDLTLGKENGDVGLTVGRYLSKGVFVSATQDTTGAGGKVTVEVEITDEFSVKTDVGQDTSGGVTAQWKKDY